MTVHITASAPCEIKAKLIVKSMFDVAEVGLLGNIVSEGEYEKAGGKGGRQSRQVFFVE